MLYKVLLSVISKNEAIFELCFETEVRELRPVQKVCILSSAAAFSSGWLLAYIYIMQVEN